MPAAAFDIRGSGDNWAILQNGRPLPQRYGNLDKAHLGLRALRRRLETTLAVPCLCCGASFKSTGKANRLCQTCKDNA